MNNTINRNLVKVIADFAILLEFSDEKILHPDIAVESMERMAMDLQLMNDGERKLLAEEFRSLSKEYHPKEMEEFIRNLPESLGIE